MIPGTETEQGGHEREIFVAACGVRLSGTLRIPREPRGIILFANGSGSSSRSPLSRYTARVLQSHGMATLLFDLLTRGEELLDERTEQLPFNIGLLAKRLLAVTEFVLRDQDVGTFPLGYFGAGTGAAAALATAAEIPEAISAIVSRGGRPDLAVQALRGVRAPTLLIVGGEDKPTLQWNRAALKRLQCTEKELIVVAGATHSFEEPETLEEMTRLAARWFTRYLLPMSKPISSSNTGSSQAGRAS